MQLADEITITLDHETIYLRPSLRAAFRLERRHHGFDKIIKGILGDDFSIMADVIRESVDERTSFADFLDSIDALPMGLAIERIRDPLIAHVMALAGWDNLEPRKSKPNAELVTFEEHHTHLFRIATGALGWTPSDAWDASPAEITEAYKGRIELLGMMFGNGDKTKTTKPDASARRRLNALGDLTVTNMSQVPSCQ